MGLKAEQTQKQRIAVTQRLVQNLEVLQMSSLELEEYICNEATDNPVIDMDAFHLRELRSKEERLRQNDRCIGGSAAGQDGKEQPDVWEFAEKKRRGNSLYEHLHMQLYSLQLDEMDRMISNYLIHCVDSKGFLCEDVKETAGILNVTPEDVERCIKQLRGLSPTGICAENMQECLTLQLEQGGGDSVSLAIVDAHLDHLARGHISIIAKSLDISIPEVRAAAERIKSLSPIPAAGFDTGEDTLYITPDAKIDVDNGKIEITICNSCLPRLRIDPYYVELYDSTDDGTVKSYLDIHLKSMAQLVQSISQREQTLMDCLTVICEIQKNYILKKSDSLTPMSMSDVADRIGAHVSTVSRAVKGKYVDCDGNIIALKELFSLKASKLDQDAGSADMIKKFIQQQITQEDVRAPLSDQQLCNRLAEKGINISRRLIAKYRDGLGIPNSMCRKAVEPMDRQCRED